MTSTTHIKIRGYHIDHFGHVNHARYLELLEEARWQYFEQRPAFAEHCHCRGVAHAVVNINIDYRQPATVGDVLRIETDVSASGRSSVVMQQRVTKQDPEIEVVRATITNVFINAKSGCCVPITDELVEAWPELNRVRA